MSTPIVISDCTSHQCVFNRMVLGYHGYWGFAPLTFPTPAPDNFFTNADLYKKYLRREVNITLTSGTSLIATSSHTRRDDVNRLSGNLSQSYFGDGGYAYIDPVYFITYTILTDDVDPTVRTSTATDGLGTYTRIETLSIEYTDTQMYTDLYDIVFSASYLHSFGTYPEIRTVFYNNSGSASYDAIDNLSAATVAFWHRYASGSNFPAYYGLTSDPFANPTTYYTTNAMFMGKFQSEVRMHYYIRENDTEELTRATVLTFPLSDVSSSYYADIFLPSANNTSCNNYTTNGCTSSLVEVLPPAFDASKYMLFKVLTKTGSCP